MSMPEKGSVPDFELRCARPSDADDIAVAHRDSIRSIGPGFYPPEVVGAWAAGLTGDVYVKAMEGGEVFFIAIGAIDRTPAVLGFASDYLIEDARYGTSVYVRGAAARRGIGSALLRLAEADAIAKGATSIHVEASLAGVEFYKANGFEEVARGETRLMSGRPIACVFMRKPLAASGPSHAESRQNSHHP
ncbi:MAG: GNAT family N-acetyltransferase [Acidobacteria bacterium]|nr:GNAT family N-acetyltransferase [Acidobacteriota bacterium]